MNRERISVLIELLNYLIRHIILNFYSKNRSEKFVGENSLARGKIFYLALGRQLERKTCFSPLGSKASTHLMHALHQVYSVKFFKFLFFFSNNISQRV